MHVSRTCCEGSNDCEGDTGSWAAAGGEGFAQRLMSRGGGGGWVGKSSHRERRPGAGEARPSRMGLLADPSARGAPWRARHPPCLPGAESALADGPRVLPDWAGQVLPGMGLLTSAWSSDFRVYPIPAADYTFVHY